MSITYNDLISRAEQVRDESEIGANTATRVGQLLADIIQWCKDNKADTFEIVNNLHDGGEENALSAEMGKVLRKNVAIVAGKVDSLINALAGIAFVGDRVSPIGQLDWEGAVNTTYSVTANLTNCSATETIPATVDELDTLSFTLEADTGYSLPYGIEVIVDGVQVAATYDRSTGEVSIPVILGDVVINAVAIDEDNIAFEGVMIEPVGTTGGYLHVGHYETSYISHLIDLGASRSAYAAVKYVGGAIAKYDSNGDYIGYGATAATEATVSVDTTTRYIRLFGATASMGDGVVKVNGVVVFDGSAVGNDDIGDADDFLASDYCPQPNEDGDYVGWMFCKRNTAFNGWENRYDSSVVGIDVKKSSTRSMVTAIGTTSQIPWVFGKLVDLPAYVNSTTKRPTAFSSGVIQTENPGQTVPNLLLYDANGAGFSYVGMQAGDTNMNTTTRVRTYALPEECAKARMVCPISAYNASRSTEETPTYFTFIKNSQTNEVLWGNDSPLTNS